MRIILFSFFLLLVIDSYAQNLLGGQSNHTNQTYASEPESLADEMLKVISGPKGQKRDWAHFRQLFLPTAQFVSLQKGAQNKTEVRRYNLEEFIRSVGPIYSQEGFEEKSTGARVDAFGEIAQVFQSFEARNASGSYQAKGINSFQMVKSEGRWWIASSTWANANSSEAVPEEYMQKSSSRLGDAKRNKVIIRK